MASENVEHRLGTLEKRHEAGGACDTNKDKVWKEISTVRERIVKLETKMIVWGGFVSIVGPMIAQYIFNRISGK